MDKLSVKMDSQRKKLLEDLRKHFDQTTNTILDTAVSVVAKGEFDNFKILYNEEFEGILRKINKGSTIERLIEIGKCEEAWRKLNTYYGNAVNKAKEAVIQSLDERVEKARCAIDDVCEIKANEISVIFGQEK